MEARRSTLGVAVLNDCIYAVGGFDGSTGLNSAEVLDLSVASPMMVISRFKIIIKLRANNGQKSYQIKGGRFDRLIVLPINYQIFLLLY